MRIEPAPTGKLIEAARHALVLPSNVTFKVAVVPEDLVVSCDPILLERVFSNLYLNAIEALDGRSRGSIITRAWLGDARTYLEVEDDGPGLDPSVVDHIFEPLVTAKATGTGLGLALCRVIIQAHGGDITATTGRASADRLGSASTGVGGGTAFRMWLPNA